MDHAYGTLTLDLGKGSWRYLYVGIDEDTTVGDAVDPGLVVSHVDSLVLNSTHASGQVVCQAWVTLSIFSCDNWPSYSPPAVETGLMIISHF